MPQLVYGVPDFCLQYRMDIAPGKKNRGGGVSVKAQRVFEAFNPHYIVDMVNDFAHYPNAHTLIAEPILFDREDASQVEIYRNHGATIKILYASELWLLEMMPYNRDTLIDTSTVVTTCCDFQRDIFKALGYESLRLCDPIPDIFYSPDTKKELSVCAMGKVGYNKNTSLVIDVFKKLQTERVKTVYIGGADLWGDATKEDEELEYELRACTDTFHYNIPQNKVAETLHPISCGLFPTLHETYSESNMEFLMTGGRGYYGGHGLWKERPGIHDLVKPDDFVQAIAKETADFSRPPEKRLRRESEDYARTHASYEVFNTQWQEVLHHASNVCG